jgi:hypothetical protein
MLKRLQAAAAASQEAEFERKPENIRSPVVPDSPGDRKKSVASSLMGSRSSNAGPSLIGLMASKRFAKKLSMKALGTRKSSSIAVPPPPEMEPTYRMEPRKKFDNQAVKDIIDSVLHSRLNGMRYSAKLTPKIGKSLSDEIKDRIKSMNIDRYKIICVLTIGQMGNQGLMLSSRCTWDDKSDSYATSSFQNQDIFCSATVYGVYRE